MKCNSNSHYVGGAHCRLEAGHELPHRCGDLAWNDDGYSHKDKQILGFAREGSCLVARPQRYFKPIGLMLWNVSNQLITACFIGNCFEMLCSTDPIPAKIFSSLQSFEEIEKAIAEGKEPINTWATLPEAYPGVDIRLQFNPDSAEITAAMWGYVIRR